MVLHDSHIHVGQFRDLYSTPEAVLDFLNNLGVDKIAASSSSTICKESIVALSEMQDLIKSGGNRIIPVLWINPDWVSDGTLDTMLNSTIKWKCLKIHGYFSRWEDKPELLSIVINQARILNIPLLLHTGGREASDCRSYLDLIKNNPDVQFILAHSRPVDQAIEVMKGCPNAWADTAFTPIDDIMQMVNEQLADRILWGTDYPLHEVFYKGQNAKSLITEKLKKLKGFTTDGQFEAITSNNFNRIFH